MWPNMRMLKVSFGRLKPTYDTRVFHFDYTLEHFYHGQKKCSLRNQKLKADRASETEERRKERLRIRRENKKIENHEKQRLTTLKRLKRGDDNELERNLKLEKVVASKQLRLAVETEEERRARLENDAVIKRLRLAMEKDEERKARLDKMVATAQPMLALIKGVVDVGVVLSLKTFLKSRQLCLSPATERNIDHELLSASLVLLYMYLITYNL